MFDALLVGLYRDPEPARMAEFITCLERNLAHEHIAEVHVFLEDADGGESLVAEHAALRHPKAHRVPHGRRATYRALFEHARRQLPGGRVIVANADIHFDHTLARLDACDLAGRLACLSRWDVQADGSLRFFAHPWSQDAWIFRAPLPAIACDFPLGLLGCDNRLAWEARAAGLEVFNPSRSVRACHLHTSQVRRYTEGQRLSGPVLPVVPGAMEGPTWPLGGDARTRCAVVRFSERMGYAVARLDAGVSSHTNAFRPLVDVPAPLAGKAFTQVVAGDAGPVDVEFVTAGRLYVLVGTDWYGYRPAIEWLKTVATCEPLPDLTTAQGIGFEVWSLDGEAGHALTIPTQVMLVAEDLHSAR